MGFRLNTNTIAMRSEHALRVVTSSLEDSRTKLATGNSINSAKDDAAGLFQVTKLAAQIRSLNQGIRNGNDAISLVDVAEGGMNETSNMLIRLKELATQAATGTVGDQEREYIDKEARYLVGEINRISLTTRFADLKLLSGGEDNPNLEFQVGTENDPLKDRISLDRRENLVSSRTLHLSGMSLKTTDGALWFMQNIDNAVNTVSGQRAYLGALRNQIAADVSNSTNASDNHSATKSRIHDTDIALEASKQAKNNVRANMNTSILAQANQSSKFALQLLEP